MKQVFVLAFIVSQMAWAQSSGGSSGGSSRPWLLSTGAEARAAKRFTLYEWLENKDRRALMDMWLSLNTPSPYEFMLGGTLLQYESSSVIAAGTPTKKNYKSMEGEVQAYARFVGLTAQYQNNNEEAFNDVTGIFNLRVFGNTLQGSHITFHYGLRTRTATDGSYRLNQAFPAATMQLYLMKYFGLYGHYRLYSPVIDPLFGETQGDQLDAGAFIEYGALRLFGNFTTERQNSKLNSIETNLERKGSKIGLQLYF